MADAAPSPDNAIVSDPAVRHGEPVVAGTATPVRAVAGSADPTIRPRQWRARSRAWVRAGAALTVPR